MSEYESTAATELNDEDKALDFYQRLRKKIRRQLEERAASGKSVAFEKLIEALAVLPDMFHLAIKCLFDKTIPVENKGALVVAIAYVVSPFDLVPDFLPVMGWLDDLIVITMGLNKFLELDKEHIRAAVHRHWAGDGDILQTIKHVLQVGDEAIEFLPRRMMELIRSIFS